MSEGQDKISAGMRGGESSCGPGSSRPKTASPLDVPLFRAIWIASLTANFGTIIQSVGASWLMIELAASPQLVAAVQTAVALPVVLLALWAGAIADSFDRRVVMLCAQAVMLLVSIILAIGAWLELLTPGLLLGLIFLVGCGSAVNNPAWQASTSEMVPREAISRAVGLNSLGFNLARSLGPAIGGVVVSVAGAEAAFALNAVSYVGLIVVLLRWRRPAEAAPLPRESILSAMVGGVRYVAMSPAIGTVLLRAILYGFAASVVLALLPLVARDLVRGGAMTYGLLLNGFGAGAVAGALASAWLRQRFTAEQVVRMATIATALGIGGVGGAAGLVPTLAALVLAGAGWVVTLTTFNVTVQMSAPRWVAGRSLAIYQTAVFSGISSGSWCFGLLVAALGPQLPLLIAAAGMILIVAIGAVMPLARVEDFDLTPLTDWHEPDTTLPIDGRSGPITISIAYRIANADNAAFLEAMNERRRVRRRDGARDWVLSRDIGTPERWVERYTVPTWFDYVRHNSRRTIDDAANFERIRALHVGAEPPEIHRMIERQTSWLRLRRNQAVRHATPFTDPGLMG